MVGDWRPGWERRPAHPSADLTADHVREVARGGRPDGPLVVRCGVLQRRPIRPSGPASSEDARHLNSPAWSSPSGCPELEQTVLGRLRTYALDHPDDPLVAWREHSATGYEDHPVDCAHCWELANPALGGLPGPDGLEAGLPPKMREASFQRARLCQLTDQLEDAWLPPSAWAACSDATRSIPDGAEVALALTGRSTGTPRSSLWPRSTSGPRSRHQRGP
jgi:hypothetical protein